MPLKFWWDTFVSAVYLLNRLPTQVLQHKSPFELLFHQHPDYHFLKTFGCACYPNLRPYHNQKFQFRTSACVFLGYSPVHKGYRCLHNSGRIYVARSVMFDETNFPYPQLFSSSSAPSSSVPTTSGFSFPFSLPGSSALVPSPTPSVHGQTPPDDSRLSSSTKDSPTTPCTSIPLISSSSPNKLLTAPQCSIHPMQTWAKSGIFKPRALTIDHQTPLTTAEALSHPQWQQAMQAEFSALLLNNTWELVPPHPDQKIVHSKWIFRIKYKADGTLDKYKARLVAKGFQQTPGVDYFETFSLVVKHATIKIIFTLAVTHNWDIQHIDVNNAFLNGDLEETVFMAQPEGFVDPQKPHFVCKLHKALYGLKQAPRAWYDRLKRTLLQWGFHNSISDPSLYYVCKNGHQLFALVYVDDILITGANATDVNQLILDLNGAFALKTLGSVHYFLEVTRTSFELHMRQTKYAIDLLSRIKMADANSCSTPMCLSNNLFSHGSPSFAHPSLYRSIIGALQYLTNTRPDIAYAVNKLSQFSQAPTNAHWAACKRILRYIKGTLQYGLSFHPASLLKLEGFSDADWGTNLDDRKSISGLCIFLVGNLISWCSKKEIAVARSNTEGEYRALASTATELIWIHQLLSEIGVRLHTSPPVLWCENMSAQALASNPVYHARTKHFELDLHFLRDLVTSRKLEVRYVSTDHQPADLLTKPLSGSRFLSLCHKLHLGSAQLSLRGRVDDSSEQSDHVSSI